MQSKSKAENRRSLSFCLIFLGLLAAVIFVPYQFHAGAGNNKTAKQSLNAKTVSHETELENYDIRTDRTASETLVGFRQSTGKTASSVADVRDGFVSGEKTLQAKIGSLKVQYSNDLRAPEVIAPAAVTGKSFLSAASKGKRSDILRNFARSNEELLGLSAAQAESLTVATDYTNPNGQMSFASLDQSINGIPVFRGEISAGFDKNGQIVRIINNLAPGLENADLSQDFGDAANALQSAAGFINHSLKQPESAENKAETTALKTVFGTGDFPNTAEKIYFPTEPGVARAAWRVLIWQPNNAYYVIVDAATGTLLWRKNLTEDQAQSSTYNIYYNANNMLKAAHNPAPLNPAPTNPTAGTQGTLLSRTDISLIGNEGVNSFNTLGWMTDGSNVTDGNNVQAGLDRDGTDGIDASGMATGTNRVFSYPYTPAPGSDSPTGSTNYQQGIVTNLFYLNNRYHDELYKLGFTESARNFQNNNFSRGGVASDRVSAEAQDSSGVNNANFTTAADGTRGKMQMYLFTGTTPSRDGDLDADVIVHEHTHGLSNRLIGNASGLGTYMARGMGEGWSDFYGNSLLSEPTDSLANIYPAGVYVTLTSSFTGNYYYGIRRFPYAVLTATGGPNNRPFNPTTFADLDSTQFSVTDGAYARTTVWPSSTVDEVHNTGEIWCTILWEARGKLVARLGNTAGNQKMLQFVTDGMKITPLNPTFLQGRDAIIAAAQAGGTAADVADLWSGFAARGLGYSAKILNAGSTANTIRVTESFDLPNLAQTPSITVADTTGNNNGYAEPGETVMLSIPLYNNTGNDATGTTLQIPGGNTVSYGTIANNTTVTRQISYTVPANTPCGSALTITLNVNSSLGAATLTRIILIGVPNTTFSQNFDGVTAPALPAGWTTTTATSLSVAFQTSTVSADTAPNAVFSPDIAPPTGATEGGDASLVSPQMPITSPAATISFRHSFNTEPSWDGGALEISIGGGAFTDILTAGGRFIQGEYTTILGVSTGSPFGDRLAWTGNSGGYITTVAQLPASAAGQNVQFRWRLGADNNTAASGVAGWFIDTVRVNGSYSCSGVTPTVKARADFDGDGKTDVSVFRPTTGAWYAGRSTAGFFAVSWGATNDKLVPGDFDGDGKADPAVYRNGNWFILKSIDSTMLAFSWGDPTDIPVQGDYDGDGKTDAAVYRPGNFTWYILKSSDGGILSSSFGATDDKLVPADFDGDGKTDIAVFRPSTGNWYILGSTRGFFAGSWGLGSDTPVPADYDGDKKADFAVYRPSNGAWYISRSSNGGTDVVPFGISSDVPVPGDYDGDGKTDIAVYRGGTWFIQGSTAGFTVNSFGDANDTPIPSKY